MILNLPLKYLLPLLLLLTGVLLLGLQSYIQMNIEYEKMVNRLASQAKVTGNRIASRITLEVKNDGFSKQKMISLSAPYMADSLDEVNIYDQNLVPIFSRFVPSYAQDKKTDFESSLAYKVVKEQFSEVHYDNVNKHMIGYFPIDLPKQEGSRFTRTTGVLYLVFDITPEYIETKKGIINTAIIDISILMVLVLLFSMFMYYLVFRRLDNLHKATLQMSKGNFDVQVKTKGKDELTQVIHTFNSMAVDISKYIHEMQEQVNKAVQEQHEQSKIMIQQSRLASMGEMIGNIAHQWRQPLNALGLLIQKIELFSKRGKLTEEALAENVDKASGIIQNMSITIDDFRDFFKPDKQMETFDLKTVVNDVVMLQEAGLKEAQVVINIDIDQPICEIYGFKNEFSQVIINLINNAKDVLIENQIENKEIFISGKNKKDQVVFKVSDNAGGVPEKIIEHIFEPYYTTKEEGKGTGIGLYMSKMIVEENMNGIMQVRNNESGAEFSMIFKKEKSK